MPTYTIECMNTDEPHGEHTFELDVDERTLMDFRSRAPAFLGNLACPTCSTAQKVASPGNLPEEGGVVVRANMSAYETTEHTE
jgi:hypothetical protein